MDRILPSEGSDVSPTLTGNTEGFNLPAGRQDPPEHTKQIINFQNSIINEESRRNSQRIKFRNKKV